MRQIQAGTVRPPPPSRDKTGPTAVLALRYPLALHGRRTPILWATGQMMSAVPGTERKTLWMLHSKRQEGVFPIGKLQDLVLGL